MVHDPTPQRPAADDHEARLTDLLEGALDDAAEADLRDLLRGDPAEAQALDDAQAAMLMLQQLPARAPSPDFARKLRRRVRRANARRGYQPPTDLLGFKLSVEVFTVIAGAVLAAFYLFAETTAKRAPLPLKEIPTQHAPAHDAPSE